VSGERIHYLDWLKVLIVYGILLFHVSLVFTTATWLVSNHARSTALSVFAGFCFPWGIPAMFLISGADAWFGLRSNSPRQFLWKRVLRLLLPMLLGLIILSPYQRFVTSHNPPPPLGELPGFYVHFFRSIRFEADPEWISKYWLHLWFLGYLFAISAVCLPLLAWLRRDGGMRFVDELVRLSEIRGGMLLAAAPLFLAQLILRPFFPAYQDWADIATYLFVFAMGAILISDRRFEAAIRRDVRSTVVVGVLAVIGLTVLFSYSNFNIAAISHLTIPEQTAFSLLWTLDVWAWNLAVLYLGIRWLNSTNPALEYAQESVLPFYVIHHPVVVTLASFIVTWQLGLWPKFAIIVVLAYAITIGIYDLGVRRWPLMRTLFGLGPMRKRQRETGHALSRA
jgi:glucans biosynthesis protein C